MFKEPQEAAIPIILVDEQDNPIGTGTKEEVHKNGLLHRAFSVFVYDNQGRILLQRRQLEKYHSGGLWTNACCGHPLPDGTDTSIQAQNRLVEEMGIHVEVEKLGHFIYHHRFHEALHEHELDHVYRGLWLGDDICPNPLEVMDYKWVTKQEISDQLVSDPKQFTAWFKGAWEIYSRL